MSAEWFYELMGEKIGPCSLDTLKKLTQSGAITPESNVMMSGGSWVMASSVADLFPKEQINQIRKRQEMRASRVGGTLPVVTTESFCHPDYVVRKTLGTVYANRVEGINVLREFLVAMKNSFGGRSNTLEKSFLKWETELRAELSRKGHEKGAHAIVRYNFSSSVIEMGNDRVMLHAQAYGTPVVLEQNAGIVLDDTED